MTGEGRQTYLEETYKTVLSPRTVLVETTDCDDYGWNVRLRWLDWIFLGLNLPSLSLNYVGMSKDIEKRLPQLYYIKMKISYDVGFIAIGVAMAT